MRKTELRITKAKVRRGKTVRRYWCVIVPKLGGGRTRRSYDYTDDGLIEAGTFLGISKTQQINYGTAALTLSPAERAEYMECREALKPYGVTLRDAIRFYLPHLKARNRASTVTGVGEGTTGGQEGRRRKRALPGRFEEPPYIICQQLREA